MIRSYSCGSMMFSLQSLLAYTVLIVHALDRPVGCSPGHLRVVS